MEPVEPIRPVAYDYEYLMRAASVDMVEDALHQLSMDPAGMSRLAVASTLDHAASAWIREIAYQVTRRGIPCAVNISDEHHRRADLLVQGQAFEFRCTYSTYGVNKTVDENRRWLAKDIRKIRDSGQAGCLVITIVTFIDGTDGRYDVLRGSTDLSQPDARDAALARFRDLATELTGQPPRHAYIGLARLPANRGNAHFDALLAVVREDIVNPDIDDWLC